MTKYFTKVYNCTDAIVDEYECFGFHDKPFEAPMQLNVGDTKAGATVVAATLNLGIDQNGLISENKEVKAATSIHHESV